MSHANITTFENVALINRRERMATVTIFAGDEVLVVAPVKWEATINNDRPNNGVTDATQYSVEIELRDYRALAGDVHRMDWENENILVAYGDQMGAPDREGITTANFSANVIQKIKDVNGRTVIIRIQS